MKTTPPAPLGQLRNRRWAADTPGVSTELANPHVHASHGVPALRGAILVPSTPEDRAELFDSTEWTRKFSWAQLLALGTYFRRYDIAAGAPLFHEGDRDNFLAIVIEGRLEIRKADADGIARVLASPGRGKMVGEMSLLDGEGRSASAVAASATTLLILSPDHFERLKLEHPPLALELAVVIARNIAQLARQTTGTLVDYIGR